MRLEKPEVVRLHESELEKWERILAGLQPAQLTTPVLPNGQSVKDTIAHLWAWQQRTIARLEGALAGVPPRFPDWPAPLGEWEKEEELGPVNAWIFESNRDRSWADVHGAWRTGYLRFLELLRSAPAPDFGAEGRIAWAAQYEPLADQEGAYSCHHAHHRVRLEAALGHHATP